MAWAATAADSDGRLRTGLSHRPHAPRVCASLTKAYLLVFPETTWLCQQGKEHHYEFDARVPFLIRGPGVVAGSTPRWLTVTTPPLADDTSQRVASSAVSCVSGQCRHRANLLGAGWLALRHGRDGAAADGRPIDGQEPDGRSGPARPLLRGWAGGQPPKPQ